MNQAQRFKFKIGQRVFVEGKEGVFIVVAAYRVEIWNVYALQHLSDFLIKETRLRPAEPDDAPGFVPRPMQQGALRAEGR